jgi:hypothetical protein
MQRAFRTRFGLNPNESISNRKTTLNWTQDLKSMGSVMNKKSTGRPEPMRIPENIVAVSINREVFIAFYSETCFYS